MVKNEVEDICPWDPWLKFRKPNLEREFLVAEYRTYCRSDMVFFGVLLGVALVRSVAWFGLGMVERGAVAGTVGVLPVLYWRFKNERWPYGNFQERQSFIFWFRLVVFVMVAMDTSKAAVEEENNLFLMYFLRTAIGPLFLTSVCLRLPFQNLVASQSIEVLILLPWIACFMKEESSVNLAAAVDRVAGITDLLCFIPITLRGRNFSWWRVGTFYHILLGLVLPLAFLYVIEAWSRAKFVKSSKMRFSHQQISSFFKDTVGCMAFVVVLVIQLLWVTLTKI